MKNTRRCKVCRVQFQPRFSMMQQTCEEPSCMIELSRRKKVEEEKQKIRVMKNNQMDVPYFKKKLQSKVQAIARHLDFGKGCISCGKPPLGMVYGGHRWAKGDYSNIRFDLHGISSQCYSCNEKKSGNVDGYVKGLEERYGLEYKNYVQMLPHIYPETKLNLSEIRLAYAKAVKIEGELNRNKKLLSPIEVIEKKNQINEDIGYHIHKFDISVKPK